MLRGLIIKFFFLLHLAGKYFKKIHALILSLRLSFTQHFVPAVLYQDRAYEPLPREDFNLGQPQGKESAAIRYAASHGADGRLALR